MIKTRGLNQYSKYYFPSAKDDPEHLFRGMSGTEFHNILKSGYIESDKGKNFKSQKKITCFAQSEALAAVYARFKPYHNPTLESPCYVVKIRRQGVRYGLNNVDEAEVKGAIPISNIVEVTEMFLSEGRTYFRKFSADEIEAIKNYPRRSLKFPILKRFLGTFLTLSLIKRMEKMSL
jgi:hypothetical protein